MFGNTQMSESIKISASIEGKAKEKLEAIGLGCLCLSKASRVPLESAGNRKDFSSSLLMHYTVFR